MVPGRYWSTPAWSYSVSLVVLSVRGWAVTDSCPSKKRQHRSYGSAVGAALRRSREAGQLRVYRCPICRHWHLTSQKNPPWKKRGGDSHGTGGTTGLSTSR